MIDLREKCATDIEKLTKRIVYVDDFTQILETR